MTRNFESPSQLSLSAAEMQQWAASRETDQVVAAAIHAISGGSRTAEVIWEAPTQAEWDHVEMAVEEYLRHGDFEASDDDRYHWGEETLTVAAEAEG